MKFRCVIFLLIVVLLIPTASVLYGQSDPAVSGGDWLLSQQAEDGSYGSEISATSLAIIALASIEKDAEELLVWLEQNITDDINLIDASYGIIALIATETDTAAFADGDLLASYTGLLREERGEDIDGLCLGLIARHNLGLLLPETAITALVQNQNEDGGFSPEAGGVSIIGTTSLCIHVLVAAEETDALENALSYLQETQLEDASWSVEEESTSGDPIATSFATQALIAADEPLTDWGLPFRTLLGFQDADTGAFNFGDGSDSFLNLFATALAIPVFRGQSLITFAIPEEVVERDTTEPTEEGPELNENWKLVGDGFLMDELNTADDFFVTVVDPFTEDELYGIEIINWTASYQYTGYIVEQYMTAEVLLWMAEQDPTIWETISPSTLRLLPAEEFEQLPVEAQARIDE